MRVMSDLELISGRVFGQLFNEYTLLFFLLPRPCQLSDEKEEPDPLNRYLDNLLASFYVGTAPTSPAEFPPASVSKLDHHLPILVFVCSRDHLVHPKTLPAVLRAPSIDIPALDPISSEGSLAAAIAAAVESEQIHCGLSNGFPAGVRSNEFANLDNVIESVLASPLKFTEVVLPPVPNGSLPHEAKYQNGDASIQPQLAVEDAAFSGLALSELLRNVLTEDTKLYLCEFYQRFRGLNRRNFVTGLYLNLVEDLPIADVDWQNALQTCVEYPTDVDISLVQADGVIAVAQGDSERLSAKVNALISSRFRRYADTNHYYYISQDELPQSSYLTEDGLSPFFLRLEVEIAEDSTRISVRADSPFDKMDTTHHSDDEFVANRVLLRLNCVSLSPSLPSFETDVRELLPEPVIFAPSMDNTSTNSLASLGSAGKKRLRIKRAESQRSFKQPREGIPRINSRRRWPQKSSFSNVHSINSETTIPELETQEQSENTNGDDDDDSYESSPPSHSRQIKSSQSMVSLDQLESRLSLREDTATPSYTFDQLPQHIALAMEKLKADLQALVAEEILLRLRSVSLNESNGPAVLTIIRDQMNRLPEGALFTETMNLSFVPSVIQIARTKLPTELSLHPLQFFLVELDDGPVLVADRPY